MLVLYPSILPPSILSPSSAFQFHFSISSALFSREAREDSVCLAASEYFPSLSACFENTLSAAIFLISDNDRETSPKCPARFFATLSWYICENSSALTAESCIASFNAFVLNFTSSIFCPVTFKTLFAFSCISAVFFAFSS